MEDELNGLRIEPVIRTAHHGWVKQPTGAGSGARGAASATGMVYRAHEDAGRQSERPTP